MGPSEDMLLSMVSIVRHKVDLEIVYNSHEAGKAINHNHTTYITQLRTLLTSRLGQRLLRSMSKLETLERCKTGKSEGKQNGGVWHSTTAHFPAFARTAEHLTEETSSVGTYAVACLLDKDHQQNTRLLSVGPNCVSLSAIL